MTQVSQKLPRLTSNVNFSLLVEQLSHLSQPNTRVGHERSRGEGEVFTPCRQKRLTLTDLLYPVYSSQQLRKAQYDN